MGKYDAYTDEILFYEKKFPRKPTAFRRGMNWGKYF